MKLPQALYRFTFVSTLLAVVACSHGEPMQRETALQSESLTFVTSAGLVSIEAEHFTTNTSVGGYSWAQTNTSTASGGAAMQATPNNGGSFNTGYVGATPRLDFIVNFAAAGTYTVWVRGRDSEATAGNSDTVHVGLNGAAVATADRIGPFPTALTWSRATLDNVNATIQVPSAGQHTVNVWMREDGFILDKLVLTSSTTYTPTGSGPAETATATPTCSDGAQNGTETGVDCGGTCPACPSCGDATCNGAETCSTCPGDCGACPPWITQDVGAVGAAGSMTFAAPTLTLKGSGDDIHSTYAPQLDEFRIAYQALAGDATLTARVVSVSNTNEWAKGGLMIRDSLNADSKFAFIYARPDKAVQVQFRSQTAQTGTDSGNPVGGTTAAKWLRIQRVGTQISAYYSTNGTSFTQVGSTTSISMAATAYVGFAVTSHNDGTLCTGSFDSIVLSGPPTPTCGDAACNGTETCTTCPADCGACPTCGNGTCGTGETCSNCPADCGACPTCGNGTCGTGETCSNCPADCGACPTCGDASCNGSETCSTCSADCGVCPPWISQDVGAIGAAGSMTFAAPTLTLKGSGDDIHSTYAPQLDEFRIAYQALVGDVTLTARVVSVSNTNEWAKGGLMIRDSLNADSKFAFVYARPDKAVQVQFRSQTAQTGTDSGNPVGGTTAVKWLRIQRAGTQISAYYSTNGTSFTQVGSTTSISMAATAYVGFAVTSHNDGTLCTGSFDSIVLTVPSPTCGNGTCGTGETCTNCPADCGACPTCGNGTCGSGETCTNCPADCGACPTCGNGTCGSGETCTNCPADCGACPTCGNGTCGSGETCTNCPADCGACPTCGNGTCGSGETCTNCPADCGACPTSGLDSRPSNTTCLAVQPLAASVKIGEVWPAAISFNFPIQVLQPPGDATRLIVVERAGFARSVPVTATAANQVATFVQLNGVVQTVNGGFLSMAFHPNWQTNRYAYVLYTTNSLIKRISRFQSMNNGTSLDASTEKVILEIKHDAEFNHNGGQIAFGSDGYLYISSGDDAYKKPARALQNASTNTLFGKVLRIDVNTGNPYGIPAGNPFASSGGAKEVYAYGLRNPWRFSFDRANGDLWLGDVGEDNWEEVNIIGSGQNYGWPYYEGEVCGTAGCSGSYTAPVYKYHLGSISGGFVYRGAAIPALQGKYVFGDYVNTTVSTLDTFTGTATAIPGSNGSPVVGFGEDNAGELYVVRFSNPGRIQKLVPDTSGGPTEYPALLTNTGCFGPTNATQVRTGVIPYSVAHQGWVDGATAERFVALPDGTKINVTADGDFVLPTGAVSIQTLTYKGQRIETRFLVRHPSGTYGAYTYEWDTAQTQATLVPPEGKDRTLTGVTWNYPARTTCFTCHTSAANNTLGLETRQLNINSFYPTTGRTANQMLTLNTIGLLSGTTSSMPPLVALGDTTATLAQRSESYLHVNCAGCHLPPGSPGGIDLRFTTPFASKNLCNQTNRFGTMGLPDGAKLLAPGAHSNSVLWLRQSTRMSGRMPRFGSSLNDTAGSDVLAQWIDSLTGCP